AWRALLARWPHTELGASGPAVGLPDGQMGNSEVGHLNIGAGRPVLQDFPRIDAAIADGGFAANPVLRAAVAAGAAPGARLHVLTLLGPGGVHAHDRHAVAFAALAREAGVQDLVVHLLLDGRDTPPRSAEGFLADFSARLAQAHPGARIGTIGGRYFGMDRDQRWDRVARHWAAIVDGEGPAAPDAAAALADARSRDESDEFVTPSVVGPEARVRDGDVVVHLNFRADRARQLMRAFADPAFAGFARTRVPTGLHLVTLTEYEAGLPVSVAFPPLIVTSLAELVSREGWTQLHVAETEKYAHVTYFFNGGVEEPWPGEDRVLVPSPKVATYDLAPAMSAEGVTDALVAAIAAGRHDVLIANLANPDMVGHTGDWDAAVRACETVDRCIGRIAAAVLGPDGAGEGGLLAVTADHGNADVMRDAAGGAVTAHSLSPVPFLLAGSAVAGRTLHSGVLADVAPTLLALLGLPPADGMTGRSLLAPVPGGGA
ncbi:MAG: 2,3-bisphosphoglycerate-independent phosphoglycerate mutase, partial [Chloroflexota bacterium]